MFQGICLGDIIGFSFNSRFIGGTVVEKNRQGSVFSIITPSGVTFKVDAKRINFHQKKGEVVR